MSSRVGVLTCDPRNDPVYFWCWCTNCPWSAWRAVVPSFCPDCRIRAIKHRKEDKP